MASTKLGGGSPEELEAEARAWVEAVTGEALGDGTLQEELKSGVVLCNLVRALSPDVIKAPSKMAMPFKQMENIGNYLGACKKLGLLDRETFQTVDLFENKDMRQVVRQLHSLGRLAKKLPGYDGPTLGPKEATENKREFTEEQLNAAKGTATFLGKGSHGTPAESISKLETGKTNTRTFGLEKEGLGTGGEAGLVGKGAHGTPGSQMSTSELLGKQIIKTNEQVAGLGTGGEQTLTGGAAVDISNAGQ